MWVITFVMELVEGETLKDRVDRGDKLEPGEAAKLGRQIAFALDFAHQQGIMHRDVKPANVIINGRWAG